ncbi:MAG: pyridoxamine 5'-phosphate oxidase [Planctomycetota bacterium]|nr:MAG: pyridoxamine 5'-phosphate oxidase [Planctomycetota bacterium]
MTHTPKQPGVFVEAITGMLACHDLPDPLPNDPMPLLLTWFEDARRSARYDDFNAMTLATAAPDGAPSARIVLCKTIEPGTPAIVFYTSYASRKGRELDTNPRAAAVFHWPHAKRQARIEGAVQRTTAAESDTYFRTRPLLSRVGASVSPQSRATGSRQAVIAEAMRIAASTAVGLGPDRPEDFGGYRILAERVELWSAGNGRLHDRAEWLRRDEHWAHRRLGA